MYKQIESTYGFDFFVHLQNLLDDKTYDLLVNTDNIGDFRLLVYSYLILHI